MLRKKDGINLKKITNDELRLRVYMGKEPTELGPVSRHQILVDHSLAVTFFHVKSPEVILEQEDPDHVLIARSGRAEFFRIDGIANGPIFQGTVGGRGSDAELSVGNRDLIAGMPWRLNKMVLIIDTKEDDK